MARTSRACPRAWRTGGYELIVHCRLGLGQLERRGAAADRCARSPTRSASATPAARPRARGAAVALAAGEPDVAAERALASAADFEALAAPVHGARARMLAGRALAAGGDRGGAIAQFERAAATFEACGALRRRDEAERELRRLGRTVYRRSRGRAGSRR